MRIVTVLQGTKFSPLQVEQLYAGCRAWIKFTDFVCITDRPQGMHPGISIMPLPDLPSLKGWWAKAYQYSFISPTPVLFLDIDVQIRDHFVPQGEVNKINMPLDYLAHYRPHKNVEYVNSSVQYYTGSWLRLWNSYAQNWQKIQAEYRGDQEWLWGEHRKDVAYLPTPTESYSWSAKPRGYAVAPVVVYHGERAKEDL